MTKYKIDDKVKVIGVNSDSVNFLIGEKGIVTSIFSNSTVGVYIEELDRSYVFKYEQLVPVTETVNNKYITHCTAGNGGISDEQLKVLQSLLDIAKAEGNILSAFVEFKNGSTVEIEEGDITR